MKMLFAIILGVALLAFFSFATWAARDPFEDEDR